MVLACGVGAFGAGVFHVMTHAFFKALLFLGAGSVIIGMHHEQDMRKMGGLRKYMPITHATMAVGWLAICGVPPFSGFFSKDAILAGVFNRGGLYPIMGVVGYIAAAMTALTGPQNSPAMQITIVRPSNRLPGATSRACRMLTTANAPNSSPLRTCWRRTSMACRRG